MLFKKAIFAAVALAGYANAHSWLECTKVLGMDTSDVNNVYRDLKVQCDGHPRNKPIYHGSPNQWKDESDNYAYNMLAPGFDGKACHPSQRRPGQAPDRPMATARPGETLHLRFWGNGHSQADMMNPPKEPGFVRVYWAGQKDAEIVEASELTREKMITQSGFGDDAIIVPDSNLVHGRNERFNGMKVTLPSNMETGRHMFVWAWAWQKNDFGADDYEKWRNHWTTCFDIQIVDGSNSPSPAPAPKPAPAPEENERPQVGANSAGTNNAPQISPRCGETCKRGGMAEYTCNGADCPPCRYAGPDGINCFDKGGDGRCPFPNGYDCSNGSMF